jgi:hypothetical protein
VLDHAVKGAGTFDPRSCVVFRGDHERLLPLFDALVNAVASRVSNPTWRVAKYYLAADYEQQTFIAVKRRGRSLIVGLTLPKEASAPQLSENSGAFNWSRMTKIAEVTAPSDLTDPLLSLVEQAARHAADAGRDKAYHGITLRDLLDANLLRAGERLYLQAGQETLAEATLLEGGEFEWQGKTYRALSDKTFAGLMGRQSTNGWMSWYVERGGRREVLASVREAYQSSARSQLRPAQGSPRRWGQ